MRWLIFLSTFAGLSVIMNLSILDIMRELKSWSKSKAVKARKLKMKQLLNYSDLKPYHRYLRKIELTLDSAKIGISSDVFLQLSLLTAVLGLSIGLFLSNILLAMVMTTGFFFMPLLFLHFLHYRYMKTLNDSINLGLSLLTNTYLQIEDLIISVKENVFRVEEPLKQVLLEFITDVEIINPDVKTAITNMKAKVENKFFGRWCDILIQCHDDRDFKNVLPAIVTEMSDVRKQQAELDKTLYPVYKDFFSVSLITIASLPVIQVLNISWYHILMNTLAGRVIVALVFLIIFAATGYVIIFNKPVSIL